MCYNTVGDTMNSKKLFDFKCSDLFLHHTLTPTPDPDDFSFKSHSHNMVEVYYFLRGNARFAVEGGVYELKRGNIVVMACGQTHNLMLSDTAAYERIALLIDTQCLPKEFDMISESIYSGNNIFELSSRQQCWFEEYVKLIKVSPRELRRGLSLSFASAVFSMLSTRIDKTAAREIENSAVKSVVDFINRHLSEELSLDIIARALYSNKASLNRKFSAIMGCSIWEYILRRRVFSARQRLNISGSITDAFEHSGFKDYSNFYRAYKKYVGLSPSEDLKKMKL